MANIPVFTTVNLLTGFLGSGKTTLLRRLLSDPALADTAVLINEFGEAGLDHMLVERIDETMVLLQSGCLCCTVRGELADSLRDLHSRRERGLVPSFSRVMIESTGLADPFPVLSTIKADPVLRHHFVAGNVITTVDAANGEAQLDTYVESNRQAAIADWLVMTKTDIADDWGTASLFSRLRRINPDAAIIDVQDPDFRVADLLETDVTPRSLRLLSASGFHCEESLELRTAEGREHPARFTAFSITVDEPIDWTGFGIWLTMMTHRHGERLLRVKGILNISGEPRPVAVHGVQHLVHVPVHMLAWPSDDRRSHLVLITDGLDAELIRRSFRAFALDGKAERGSTVQLQYNRS